MIALRILLELGPWLWMLAALVLMAAEFVLPPFKTAAAPSLTLGLAAFSTGCLVIALQFTNWPLASPMAQWAVFAVLSVLFFAVASKHTGPVSDQVET
jgi:membrane protein implicated in regulation of membrane protease activity